MEIKQTGFNNCVMTFDKCCSFILHTNNILYFYIKTCILLILPFYEAIFSTIGKAKTLMPIKFIY